MSNRTIERPTVDADLIEATPIYGGLGHWILASPMILFLAWNWIALIDALGPTAYGWLNILLASILFLLLIILPFGYAAHWLITALPRLFQRAGWELLPRQKVPLEVQYTARYIYRSKERAQTNWSRIWMRCAQGWVYLEIATIFAGALLLVPLFFSVSDFGFGR